MNELREEEKKIIDSEIEMELRRVEKRKWYVAIDE